MWKKALVTLLLLAAFAISAQAYTPNIDAQLDASGAGQLADTLPPETRDLLADLGLGDIDLYGLLNVSPRDIINQLLNMLQGSFMRVLRSGALAMGVIMLMAYAFSILPEDEKMRRTLEIVGSMLALILLLPGLAELMRAAAAVVQLGANFNLALIPVLAGL
ncbi:MAG: hypothetical protein FWB76_04865, partial [Oscillospiraceae bacterium]|nr:hypothetical protein [Oscillospiraceae bacterium]